MNYNLNKIKIFYKNKPIAVLFLSLILIVSCIGSTPVISSYATGNSTEWSEWSAWSKNKETSSETVQVETKQHKSQKTQYRYHVYADKSGNYHFCTVFASGKYKTPLADWNVQYTPWLDVSLTVVDTGYYHENSGNYKHNCSEPTFYKGERNSNEYYYEGHRVFYEETRVAEETITEYRYRTAEAPDGGSNVKPKDDNYTELICSQAIKEWGKSGNKAISKSNKYNDYVSGAWCVSFLRYCARQAGVPENIIPQKKETINNKVYSVDSCSGIKTIMETNYGAVYHPIREGYVPKDGDFIYYGTSSKQSSISHIGLIVGTVSRNGVVTQVETIEGNTTHTASGKTVSSCIAKKTRSISTSKVTSDFYVLGFLELEYVKIGD